MPAKYPTFLKGKIPREEKKKIEFGMLIALARENKIRSTIELKSLINDELYIARTWLARNKTTSTINRIRREYARKLQELTKIKEITDKYF
jgi:hypothetical protein